MVGIKVLDIPEWIGWGAGVIFILVLIWQLSRTGPSAADLPEIDPFVFSRLSFQGTVWVIIASLVLMFIIGIVVHPQLVVVFILALIALRLIIRWRHRVSGRLALFGVFVGVIPFLLALISRGFDPYMAVTYLVFMPLLFIGGVLLLEYTQLTHIRILKENALAGMSSFLWGCVLALPPSLLNALGGSHSRDVWVDDWWDPLTALVPGITEEIWARLFLTTLCYALLRPTTTDRPRRAVFAAIFIGAITHGLAHLPTFAILSPAGLGYIVAGLLYGVPMALLFIKRDLEQAIGYHFFVDFVRFLAALFIRNYWK